MLERGLNPPEIIEPGRFYRFPGRDKRSTNRAGWCIRFPDGLGGTFGDWSSDLRVDWHARRDRPLSRSEHAARERQLRAARAAAAAEQRASQAQAANRAFHIWERSAPASASHPYLRRKRILAHGARLSKGALVLPVTNFSGQLTSLQFIGQSGSKRLLSGGRKQGCCIRVAGDNVAPTRVIVCEGWATGCTLAEDDPDATVLAAIDSGNLESVAIGARQRWPMCDLVVAGDDDRLSVNNLGASKAQAAAVSSGALLALPQWPEFAPQHLSDFNDLAVWLAGDVR